MKKTTPSAPPDLTQEFSTIGDQTVYHIEDHPAAPPSAEVEVYKMLKEIAQAFCTEPGDKIPTRPASLFSSDQKWGPYYIVFMPYDESAAENQNTEEPVDTYDHGIYRNMTRMASTFMDVGAGDIDVVDAYGVTVLKARTIEALFQSTANMLDKDAFPGSPYQRANLVNRLPLVYAQIEQEKSGLRPGAAGPQDMYLH